MLKPLMYTVKRALKDLLFKAGYYSNYYKKNHLTEPENEAWKLRMDDVLRCADNKDIPRVAEAGKITGAIQLMHNGLKIRVGSYYGQSLSELLTMNKGVHEPQEEKVFAEVIKYVPDNSVMIELGAYWSFYSMWWFSKIKNAGCYMIEPDDTAINFGKSNFQLNKMKGDFTNAFI